MKELIEKLTEKAGLSAEQATNALTTMKEHLTEKFPMLEDVMNNMLGMGDDSDDSGEGSSIADKAGDMLGDLKEKAGDLLDSENIKGLASNAGEMADEAIDKLKGIFGSKDS